MTDDVITNEVIQDETINEIAENEVVEEVDNLPIQQMQKNIDTEIAEVSERLFNGSGIIGEDLNRLSYLQKIKNSLRYASLNEQYDNIIQVVLDRFKCDFPTFTNRELLDYATQLQQILEGIRKSTNDDLSTLPIVLQNNTQVNIVSQELDRASKERVADAVKEILKGAQEKEMGQ